MAFLDHLVDLGVNAVELLPMAEFSGNVAWGYGDSHHFCVESSAGGRDKYRHFVRECHRRGIAVIQDVVYNHYDNEAERAQWQYDSTAPEENIYYWYEGHSSDYSFLGWWLSRQRLFRIHAALLGRNCAPAVHQQRGLPDRGNARRWAARGLDSGDSPRQRPPRRWTFDRQRQYFWTEVPARMEPHLQHDPALR